MNVYCLHQKLYATQNIWSTHIHKKECDPISATALSLYCQKTSKKDVCAVVWDSCASTFALLCSWPNGALDRSYHFRFGTLHMERMWYSNTELQMSPLSWTHYLNRSGPFHWKATGHREITLTDFQCQHWEDIPFYRKSRDMLSPARQSENVAWILQLEIYLEIFNTRQLYLSNLPWVSKKINPEYTKQEN